MKVGFPDGTAAGALVQNCILGVRARRGLRVFSHGLAFPFPSAHAARLGERPAVCLQLRGAQPDPTASTDGSSVGNSQGTLDESDVCCFEWAQLWSCP